MAIPKGTFTTYDRDGVPRESEREKPKPAKDAVRDDSGGAAEPEVESED